MRGALLAITTFAALTSASADDMPVFKHALTCSYVAATVYAELTTEDADSVVVAATRKCAKEWSAASRELREASVRDLERITQRKLTPEELSLISPPNPLSEGLLNEMKLQVIEWRSQATMGDQSIYDSARQKAQAMDLMQ